MDVRHRFNIFVEASIQLYEKNNTPVQAKPAKGCTGTSRLALPLIC
jgi:hypothetical protein